VQPLRNKQPEDEAKAIEVLETAMMERQIEGKFCGVNFFHLAVTFPIRRGRKTSRRCSVYCTSNGNWIYGARIARATDAAKGDYQQY
jgi:hypothetical protein